MMSDQCIMKMKIAKQLVITLQNLGAPAHLLFLIGSYGDTQTDEDVLEMLEQYNERGTYVHEVISPAFRWEPGNAGKDGSHE